jgi:hypothetical protein
MSAVKQAAIGTALWIGDAGSPETFFLVSSAKDFAGPKMKADTIDVTTQDSASGYKEFISSLKDGQEVTFPIEFDPNFVGHNEAATIAGTQAGGLKYLFEQRAKRNMAMVYPTSPFTKMSFVGVVVGFEPDNKVMGSMLGNITIKVSGKPTLGLGSVNGIT